MYKYFRQRDCAYHLPAIAMQIYTTSIVPLFIKSSPYPLIQTRDDISHIEYPPPPPPVLRVTKYARAISRYATGRLRIIYTRLSLRPCFFSRLCYDHVGSSQRVVLLEQKIIFGTVARRSRERKKKKKIEKKGEGASNRRFSRRFYELTWFHGVVHVNGHPMPAATPCVLMDVDLKMRSFSCSCRGTVLQATDSKWGGLHKIPDFYFEKESAYRFYGIVIAWSTKRISFTNVISLNTI